MLYRDVRMMVVVSAGLLGAFLPGMVPVARSLPEIADERIRLARAALDELDRGGNGARVQLTDRTPWLRRIAETRREHGGQPAEVVADLRRYASHLERLEAQLREESAKPDDLDEVRYARLEAEAWVVAAIEGQSQRQRTSR